MVLILLLLLVVPAWAVGPTCDQATNLACAGTCSNQFVRSDTNPGPTCSAVLGTDFTDRWFRVDDYVSCAGTADATSGLQTALNAAAGRTLFIPTGCKLGLASPGAGNAAVTIPNGTRILCEDQSAGFFAREQFCSGGTYPGAACNTSAECLNGGTCVNSFGGTTANPCSSSTCFAPTGGSTYTMLKDANAISSNITIENCSFWTYQADLYQRCVGGSNAGDPCRQECDANTTVNPGAMCETNANCVGGSPTCLRVADCHAASGTCGAVPHSASGAGKINPIDLTRTSGAVIKGVSIYDHFVGDFGVNIGAFGKVVETNAARAGDDCFDTLAPQANQGTSCYSAYQSIIATSVQPTVAVTNGIITGADTQVERSTARGSTTAFTGGARTRFDECTVWPPAAAGPGTASNGFSVGADGQIAKSYVMNLISNGTGIILSGTNGIAIANKIKGVTGSAIGVQASGQWDEVRSNYIEGNAATGIGIDINAANAIVTGNVVNSNAVDTLSQGIVTETGAFAAVIEANEINRVKTYGLHLGSNQAGTRFSNNIVGLIQFSTSNRPTAALSPIHVMSDGTGTQVTMGENYFSGGWRGFATGARATGGPGDGLTNTQIRGNRFTNVAGAAFAAGGAGLSFNGNYVNTSTVAGNLTCDASCSNPGAICYKDTDCTACNGSVKACIPEAVVGYIGSPTAVQGASHPQIIGNIFFDGRTAATQQCTTVANGGALGQKCTVGPCAAGNCNADANGQGVCATGGALCCSNAAGAGVCGVRTATPFIRVVDYGAATADAQGVITTNQFFGGSAVTDTIGIDFLSSASLGNISFTNFVIGHNYFEALSSTNTIGIRFPTSGTFSGIVISNQDFVGFGNDVTNWNVANGSIIWQNTWSGSATAQSANLATSQAFSPAITSAQAGRYQMNCSVSVTRAATTSSTAPDCVLHCTDPVDSVAKDHIIPAGQSTTNTTAAGGAGTGICDAAAGTGITWGTTRYASSGATTMQYKVYVQLERLME